MGGIVIQKITDKRVPEDAQLWSPTGVCLGLIIYNKKEVRPMKKFIKLLETLSIFLLTVAIAYVLVHIF